MAINSLSPAFIKILYSNGSVQHKMVLPTKFDGAVTPGVNPNLLLHSSANNTFTSSMSSWGDLLKPCFGTGTVFNSAEVWSQPTPDDDPVWIYTYGMGQVGTHASANITAEQVVMTFRSDLGGLSRLYLMETPFAANVKVLYGAMANPLLAVANFVVGSSSWIWSRDNGKPILCLQYKTKYNDVLRRKLLTG